MTQILLDQIKIAALPRNISRPNRSESPKLLQSLTDRARAETELLHNLIHRKRLKTQIKQSVNLTDRARLTEKLRRPDKELEDFVFKPGLCRIDAGFNSFHCEKTFGAARGLKGRIIVFKQASPRHFPGKKGGRGVGN